MEVRRQTFEVRHRLGVAQIKGPKADFAAAPGVIAPPPLRVVPASRHADPGLFIFSLVQSWTGPRRPPWRGTATWCWPWQCTTADCTAPLAIPACASGANGTVMCWTPSSATLPSTMDDIFHAKAFGSTQLNGLSTFIHSCKCFG